LNHAPWAWHNFVGIEFQIRLRVFVADLSATKPTLLVMAAGMGSRFGGLKQVEPVGPGGESLLDYSVFDALRAGFGRVVFVIRRDFEEIFREQVGRRFGGRVAIDYVFQELTRLPGNFAPPVGRAKPWGTAHAVWCAAGVVNEPFAAINADDFYGRDAFAQVARFLGRSSPSAKSGPSVPCALAGYRLGDTLSEHGTVSRGVCLIDRHGQLTSIEERTNIERSEDGAAIARASDGSITKFAPDTIVSMNCWGFPPTMFSLLEATLTRFLAIHGSDLKAECYLPTAVTESLSAGIAAVDVLPVRGSWFGITHRDDKPRVVAALAQLIASGEYPARLWT
jgi:hypothetical protein